MPGPLRAVRKLRWCRLAGWSFLAAGAAAAALGQGQLSPTPTKSVVSRPLDLSAPPIRMVLTPEQIAAMTVVSDDQTPTEEVTVKKPHYQQPVPVGQLRAIPWALLHPLQAWRIFAPIGVD